VRWTARFVALAALLFSTGLTVPAQAAAQRGWFPDAEPFERLIASPREVGLRGSFIVADRTRDLGYEGKTLEAEVALAQRFGIFRFDDDPQVARPLTLHFEFGIFTRFYMEEVTRDLVNADFRFALPIEYARGRMQLRVGYRHLSSHVGDDFLYRFPPDTLFQASKDGLEGLVSIDVTDAVRLYGGGDFNFHRNRDMSAIVLRGGFELEPPRERSGSAWPFLAVDAQLFSHAEDVGVTFSGGVAFRLGPRLVRLEGRGHVGPTFMAQFRETEERFFGLGMRIEI